MPTKARGPLQVDYARAIRAAKKAGAPAVRLTFANVVIEIPLGEDYLGKLASAQPPALDTGKRELRGPRW